MTEKRYKVTLTREDQPPHQMAEMTTTVSGGILRNIVERLIEQGDGGLASWMTSDEPDAFNFGTFKSITIAEIDDTQA